METWGLIIVSAGIAVLLILLLREVFCWYAKTNRILRKVEEILARLPEASQSSEEPPQQAAS